MSEGEVTDHFRAAIRWGVLTGFACAMRWSAPRAGHQHSKRKTENTGAKRTNPIRDLIH